ncbi:MAG: hypothetical protein TREMPRED_003292 [Tremellales sp. Tagirdzhanova-0007]|nr:MAG: hypothetical protein TREMPRED_003292 [Tremellales sp. Tagirdzhanova-0007]
MLRSLTALLTAVSIVAAHTGCGGVHIGRRNLGGEIVPLGKRQVTDEPSAATSLDVNYECTPYSYAPLTAVKSSFPAIWETATILPSDTVAQSLFATINTTVNSRLPNDLPKDSSTGSFNGNFTGVNYTAADPDCWWTWQGCTTPAASTGLSADITTVPEPLTWGLAFDDGPNCSHNALYDFLLENDQKATMYMTSFTNEEAFAELYYTRQMIKEMLGVTPLCWRPPYGDVDNRIRLIAAELNLTTIVWSDDTEDWRYGFDSDVTLADVVGNYQSVINKSMNGTYATHGPVVLTHELTNFTMGEMMMQYPLIKAAFQHVVPIAVAYNLTQPYAETNISYPSFSQYAAGNINQTTGASASSSASASTSASASSTSGTTSSGSSSSASSSSASGSSSSKAGSATTSASTAASSKAAAQRELGMSFGVVGGVIIMAVGVVGGALFI